MPLDEVRGWWRYHHLFADLLRARLEMEQPGRVVQLHCNASLWYSHTGWPMTLSGTRRRPGTWPGRRC